MALSVTPVISAVLAGGPLLHIFRNFVEPDGVLFDEVAVDPMVIDHEFEDAGKERHVATGFHRKKQVTGSGNRSEARILHDDFRPLLSGLPHIVCGDGGAGGDVGAGNPNDLTADHIGPWIGNTVDAEGLFVGDARGNHAEAAVIINERRLEADAGELPHEVGFFGSE